MDETKVSLGEGGQQFHFDVRRINDYLGETQGLSETQMEQWREDPDNWDLER